MNNMEEIERLKKILQDFRSGGFIKTTEGIVAIMEAIIALSERIDQIGDPK